MKTPRIAITGAVEGTVDEAVLRRLVQHVGAKDGAVHGKRGKSHLRVHIEGYNNAARFDRWLVLVDLDNDADCAPSFCRLWMPDPAPLMCFGVAVREIEAWLMADKDRFASFLGVTPPTIPENPDAVVDAKRAVVQIAGRSRRREIREDMVPRPGSGRKVGPAYESRVVEFVTDTARGWRPDVASEASDSLRRCIRRLAALAAG